MSLKKFNRNDILYNTMKAYPSCKFFIYDGTVYYNNIPNRNGRFVDDNQDVLNIPPGYISLYEYNVDKLSGSNNFIYPFITKDSARSSFKTVGRVTYTNEFVYGDVITGSYPMSASITREYIPEASSSTTGPNKHFYALKNRLNFLGLRSEHYKVTGAFGDKNEQEMNLISIPSIFYGSQIQPGSVSLKWYNTGSIIGELQDTKQNGELVEVSGSSTGSVAGVVLYDEGFLLLTGSWDLNSSRIPLLSGSSVGVAPKWIYFGAGANDGVSQDSTDANYVSASFDLSFNGTTKTQVLTMFAHAKRGQINYSNNPTYIEYGQDLIRLTSSFQYLENNSRTITNIVSSSYSSHSASYRRQVYISRIGIYDAHKNLLGIATLSNPILKEEDQDYAFKLRLDI